MPGRIAEMGSPIVATRDLGKTYRVYPSPWDRILEALLRRRRHREFSALADVSLEVPRGEGLGIIGQNGAGKSTLLKMLAGIVTPSQGSLEVRGKVASILELGSAFHPEFTGRENIRLNAAMLGLSGREVTEKTPEIIRFSELGEFIDQPVKTYSTGMAMRLGFAIATQVEPEVLIIDEALSVGDGYFQKKCMDHLQAFLAAGGTLLFCSHAMYYVSAFCRRALWLRHGRVEAFGPVDEVIREYETFLLRKEAARNREESSRAGEPGSVSESSEAVVPADDDGDDDPGRRAARILRFGLAGRTGSESEAPAALESGSALALDVEWESSDPELSFHLGVGLNRADEIEVASFSSFHDGVSPWTGATSYRARLLVPELSLVKGEFSLYLFLLDERGLHIHDQRILPRAFRVAGSGYRFGLVRMDHTWERPAEQGGTTARPLRASFGGP